MLPSTEPLAAVRPAHQASTDPLHDEALLRVDLLRKLFPDRERYACQGYGHLFWPQPLPYGFDSTHKTGIPHSMLPPRWLTQLNAVFRGLAQRPHRPADWPEYAHAVLALRQSIVRDLQHLERRIDAYFKRRTETRFVGEGGAIDAESWQQHKRDVANPPLLPLCALDDWGFFDESSVVRPSTEADGSAQVQAKSWALHRYSPFLTPFKKYTRALANFYDQSLHVMLLNPALGRGNGAATAAGRARILQTADEVGLHDAAPRLSIHNLMDAVQSLEAMQQGARALLDPFLDPAALARLEHQEQNLFARFWTIWYWFAFHPRQVIPNAVQECPRRAADLLRQQRKALRRAFDSGATQDRHLHILSDTVHWGDTPALWLTLNCTDPAEIYAALDEAMSLVRQVIGKDDGTSLRHFALTRAWPRCIVVPLVRGKLLEPTAWSFHLSTLLSEGGLNWIHGLRQAIPHDAMTALDLRVWSLPRLDVANRLLGAMSTLPFLVGHLRHLNQLPDLDDRAFSYGQDYIQRICNHLGEIYRAANNAASEMLDHFHTLPSPEQEQRIHLEGAMLALRDLYNSLPPELLTEGTRTMQLQELVGWANALEETQHHALLAYLSWVTDVLDAHDPVA